MPTDWDKDPFKQTKKGGNRRFALLSRVDLFRGAIDSRPAAPSFPLRSPTGIPGVFTFLACRGGRRRSDPEGIRACSRWWRAATPPEEGPSITSTPAGVLDRRPLPSGVQSFNSDSFWRPCRGADRITTHTGGVAALYHRLQAAKPPASLAATVRGYPSGGSRRRIFSGFPTVRGSAFRRFTAKNLFRLSHRPGFRLQAVHGEESFPAQGPREHGTPTRNPPPCSARRLYPPPPSQPIAGPNTITPTPRMTKTLTQNEKS